ncbi:oligopeptide transport system ATP-binding protein [Saccharopolyspora antimicrobica]|uniref:Oligopeptide transport system ATP-binding protein n=1 Tax=Saccharopolyspora antimicrobica TaxID=455193 RepID=A0A1I4VVH7_9PSEU|nr:oligopeptide/dipeptide ABC transporter ATP-binding protein [Saccharopolyspora antimicrobica]RKT87196.1 oligopeptide transport system ATP-binding protein [Saccharopolyspora antimicrobica]SFN05016.1 oligopeptide transport system ATP-binding protein [Saccharopolyspora antimicrobica]
MSEHLLQTRDLTMHFPARGGLFRRRGGLVRAVDGVDIGVRRGETLGLVGESGCGKSTLARLLLRLATPTSGEVLFEGENIFAKRGAELSRLRRDVQMVFQNPSASVNPRLSVGEIIAEPLRIQRQPDVRRRVAELMEMVGLHPDHRDRYPHEFSGGQRQRMGIARAIALRPKVVVCDEPVSALDVSIQAQILELLKDLQRELGLTYVFITHDLSVVKHLCDRVAVMYLGKVVEVAERADFFAAPAHPYTASLLSAIPLPDPDAEARRKRVVLSGDVPSAMHPPTGCAFHPRCPKAQVRCSQDAPPPTGAGNRATSCFFPLRPGEELRSPAEDGARA